VYAKLRLLWESARTSFWVVPALMILCSVALAFAALLLDSADILEEIGGRKFIYRGGPEGARETLATIAGSMITIAGVVFSITIVVLSLASEQMGPRLIRNFIHDGLNQVVLGTFTSTFTFCILILVNVRGEENEAFVPQVSITLGLALALLSILVLIIFIHHIARQIQITFILSTVGHELEESLERIVPLQSEPPTPQDRLRAVAAMPPDFETGGVPVLSTGQGYLTLIDIPGLVELAAKHDLLVRLDRTPGEFVIRGSELGRVWTKGEPPEDLGERVCTELSFDRIRTPVEDLGFAFDQLVEIGVRALSPSTNDPFSAMSSLNQLAAGLTVLAGRPPAFPYHYDDKGRVRVVDRPPDFERTAEYCLTPLRFYGRDSLPFMLHFLSVLERMAPAIPRKADRKVLSGHAMAGLHSALPQITSSTDRRMLEGAYERTRKALEKAGP
jgi:uncharacterized membrane protein